MIESVIPLVESFLPFWNYALVFLFAGYALVFIFNFISHILRGG